MTGIGFTGRLIVSAATVVFAVCAAAQAGHPPAGGQYPTSGAGANPRGAAATDAMPADSMNMHGQMDNDFVRKMVKGNQSEIDAGNLAVKNGDSEDVKKFGQKMVEDHTMLLNGISKVAKDQNIDASPAPSSKDKAKMAKMAEMTGPAFDRAYVEDMVKDHKKDVSELKQESMNGSNPEVKDAASKALPVVQGHLEMIEGIQKKMMAQGSNPK